MVFWILVFVPCEQGHLIAVILKGDTEIKSEWRYCRKGGHGVQQYWRYSTSMTINCLSSISML